jgi:hypothetical protein
MGFPEWTAQFCVWKMTGKDSSEACTIACQKCAVYSVFPSGMTSRSKIPQFKWQCIGRLTLLSIPSRWSQETLQNIGNFLWVSMGQHPRRVKSSTELRTSWNSIPFSAMREVTVMVVHGGVTALHGYTESWTWFI